MRSAVGSFSVVGIVLIGILVTGGTALGADGGGTEGGSGEASITSETLIVPSDVIGLEGEAEGEPARESAPSAPTSVPALGLDAVPLEIGGLTFTPSRPAPGGSITVTGSGCMPGEAVLIRTWIPTLGSFTYHDVPVTAAADGSFTVDTHVYGAPGSEPVPAAGTQFGLAAYCGGVATTDPEFSQIVYGLIAGVNAAPVAISDTYPVAYETALVVGAPGVLSNDGDADGDRITAHLFTDTTSGTLTNFMPDGSFTYTPDAGFSGTDSFVYYAWDGVAGSADVAVTLTVAPPPPPMSAVDDTYLSLSGVPLRLDVLINDLGAGIEVTSVTVPSAGTAVISADGLFIVYTSVAGFVGTDTFRYTITNDAGDMDIAEVDVSVLPSCAFGLCSPVDPVDPTDSGEAPPVEVRAPGGTSPTGGTMGDGTTTNGLAETGGSFPATGYALLGLTLLLFGAAAVSLRTINHAQQRSRSQAAHGDQIGGGSAQRR